MATPVNTHDAKTHFSELLRRVEQGEEVVIARNGKPVARLVPIEETAESPPPKRVLGLFKDQIVLHPGWDDPLTEEEMADWYDAPFTTNPEENEPR